MAYITQAPYWNGRPCAEYASADDASWLTRDCLVWAKGDRAFELEVATDLMESQLARCYRVEIDGGGARHDFGICAPMSCKTGDVVEHFDVFMDVGRLAGVVADDVRLMELAPWRALANRRVDFVIAGFPNSGTSSLARTLAGHPEVRLVEEELDIPQLEAPTDDWSNDWREWLCADLLPWQWMEDKLPKKASDTMVQGLKNPMLLYSKDCVQRLSRALPKLVVALRDPTEWMLSVFRHKQALLGFALRDWEKPPLSGPARSSWLGRDHAKFGTILQSVLETWPAARVHVVELEHLRTPQTAKIAVDSVCRFLGVTPFSELAPQGGEGPLRYARGLGTSSPAWGPERLCAPDVAHHILQVAASFAEEYAALPRLLARVGVLELGVSSTIASGGVHARACLARQVALPGAAWASEAPGRAEQLVTERRLHVAWRGELGFRFRTVAAVAVRSVGVGIGEGPLRGEVRVSLWDAASRQPLVTSSVGPGSPSHDGFAYAAAFAPPIVLEAGATYDVTAQVAPGLGVSLSGHAGIRVAPGMGEFLSGVFSRGPWLYPEELDEHSWEEAYCALLNFQIL